ncbi:MAG: hypothetical protein E7477_00505 [Ruminococcaceae bacterium]|nr:hypothetical protein [Oscillospiraceae bacterium]
MMKKFTLFVLTLIIVFLSALPMSADMGPKPSITIYVENVPDELYYLDLLIEQEEPNNQMTQEEIDSYDPQMLTVLREYNENGLRAALSYGSAIPIFGQITGKQVDGKTVHVFSYYGIPDTVKVIAVTKSGEVHVSESVEKTEYQAEYILDFQTFSLESTGNTIVKHILQFFSTFIPTLIIELLILILFGFSVKKNIIPFIAANFATQVFLTVIYAVYYPSAGVFFINFAVLPIVELIIISVEAVAYCLTFKDKSKARKIVYAVVANLCSWIGYSALTALVPFVSDLWL